MAPKNPYDSVSGDLTGPLGKDPLGELPETQQTDGEVLLVAWLLHHRHHCSKTT